MYNRDSKIMRKLLGKTAADASTGDLAAVAAAASTTPVPGASAGPGSAYRPSKSQNAVYPAGVPISCFDVAPDRRAAVLAGPHILKTVVLDAKGSAARFGLGDGIDVRAAIASRQSAGLRASVVADQLNIRDVKWHGHSTIFTACASGNIFAYDLARLGAGAAEPLECVQMHEDSRQVNSLDVNPHLKSWLLSGSQDGTARVFDTSTPLQSRAGLLTFRQRFAPLRCIDAVRQVAWSPGAGHEMACCTEAGVVLKWDVRHPARPLLRINAHEKACSAIAWHPDGIHLMSAGWDTKLHTWDLGKTADKRQKPKWTISTPAPVSAIAWRPGLWSATTQTRRVAQVAVAYDETTNRRYGTSAVHVWDLARPTMPYKEIERFDSSPTALLWQDQDLLWTVGQDGLFNQCDVAFAPKALDRQSTSAMAFSPRGEALVFLDERPQSHRPRPSVTHEPQVSHRHTYGSSPGAPMLSVSRSDSEEEVMSTFLGPRRRVVGNRRPGGRSGAPLSTTPPSGPAFPDDPKQTLNLEQSVAVTGVFKPQQAMASGRIPAAKSVHVYQYLSSTYLETLERELPYVQGGDSLAERVDDIMEQFARAAENANQYRLAQTWRILAYSMALLLNRRAQYHLELRVGQFQKMHSDDAKGSARLKAPEAGGNSHSNGEDTPRRPSVQRGSVDGRMPSRSLLAEEIESTSNVPTPVARPADAGLPDTSGGNDDGAYQYGRRLTPIVEPESLHLGPAAHGSYQEEGISPRHRLDPDPVSGASNESSDPSQLSSTEGYDFYDTDVLAKAIDVPLPKKRSMEWGSQDQTRRGQDPRQDSGESFGNMFSVSDGTKRSAARSSSSGGAFARPSIMARQASDTDRSSAASSVEYDSRIRGEAVGEQEAPTASRTYTAPSRNGGHQAAGANTPEEVFMISQTTADTYPSQPLSSDADASPADTESPTAGNAVPGMEVTHVSSPPPAKPTPATSTLPRHDPRPHIVESDYLPWDDDPPYPHPLQPDRGKAVPPPPLDPIALVTRALAFETQRSALNASAMVLLLRPLVPPSAVDEAQASAVVQQQHARLTRMGLFVEAALLRNLCVGGWPAGLPDWGAGSGGGGGPYAAIFSPAQQGVKVGLVCPDCRKPREVNPAAGAEAVWTCERCRCVMAPCAVCGHRELERPAQVPDEIVAAGADGADNGAAWLSEWWCCPWCAHGGHASCLQTWHAAVTASPDKAAAAAAASSSPAAKFSDGCCPLDGCGHACLPGKYRGETMTARADEHARAALEAARVRDDPLRSLPGPAPAPAPASASAQTPPPPPPTLLPAPLSLHPPGPAAASSSSSHAPLPPSPLSPLSVRHPPPQPHHQHQQRASAAAAAHVHGPGRRASPHARAASVRGDAHDVVPQSKAVGAARESLLSRGPGSVSESGGGILGSSPSCRPASAPLDRERRKSVKFARPEGG
ncbi:WD repeat-containing protein [Hirsutella rhossiliensis]|uniref:WD repeat-containing protein n=1 Tax=Hirsutella rhossiliensis TaxID=111463 RepID=A0A9P8SEP2_9HYPO|nr:WD repeat-containing protein [Hirsutella rhossiliensis]KAH0959224.1 WD repeat-containing protein [Hirsutella rhossiliensis]